jgi:hypothetical protein
MNIVITIISTIILAVTVLTLILGILAYIVYKMRRRGGKKPGLSERSEEEIAIEPEPKKPKTTTPTAPLEKEAAEIPSLIRRYEPEKKPDSGGGQAEWK